MEYAEYKKKNIEKLLKEKKYNLTNNNFFNNLKSDICKNCIQGDCCCNKYPCIFSPNDFIDITNIDYMKSILDTGLIYVNIAKNSNFFTIRPIGKREIYSEPRYQNNACVFYSIFTGCMLDDYMRPTQGLLLIAQKDLFSKCNALYTKEDIYNDYKPYQDILKELYRYQLSINHYIEPEEKEEKVKQLVKRITGDN